ncbi:MAG: NAD(P)/FAD-dependent oxidoreductase [Acidobacteria bacterium]|nr:MAG: NAD(P)/FAD-dependent oxidoreductase [Acidobacteriota bacterium]REJ98135.1 MAG: NAD(P)/FAD-dependent oxidoreductase [Acidobacteriota bacterium]REK16878.1 MAG: NAD(P)/FAD-dependent oxidoreductase [Acidobacteriota bacterium]REK42789.1 MAG: NAD(P)/FAD-dependent oxidoreductase [Acidobacteriota bacterium]
MNYFDVIIVGAGLSGIGAGAHLRMMCPDKSFTILEGRESMGGTWDLFRYPGVRSDSDMYTLGYRFRPWKDPEAIADGPAILKYIHETSHEYDLDKKIRYSHRVKDASWSSDDERWTVEAETPSGAEVFTCSFLYLCTGYYKYEAGYTPDWPHFDRYKGTVVHPQKWPENLDYSGKKVLVIGSGATAVTLVPAMSDSAEHVTMLQRSPTYIVSRPARDKLANFLNAALPAKAAYGISRWKNVLFQQFFYSVSKKRPEFMKRLIAKGVKKEVGEDFDMRHFTPDYDPWDQRLCLVPDSDLFEALKKGRVSIVTDEIEEFTETGVMLKSGESLDADIVVTATGLVLKIMSGLDLHVDGSDVDLSEKFTYKGMMYSDIPNIASAFGYTNNSWTLKCDLTSEFVCRLINHMDENGYKSCTPRLNDPEVERVPVLDFNSGYVLRALDELPSQGSKMPWKLHQNYIKDVSMIRYGKLEDGAMEFR